MWLALLSRFWKPALSILIVGGLVLAVHHRGYEAGVQRERAEWEPRFKAAESAKIAADAKTAAIESASEAVRVDLEKSHAETVRDLESAAAASGVRVTGLLRELAARPRSCSMPEVAGGVGSDARAAEVERRLGEIGERIAGVGRDCANDAAAVRLWQQFYERNAALRRASPTQ